MQLFIAVLSTVVAALAAARLEQLFIAAVTESHAARASAQTDATA